MKVSRPSLFTRLAYCYHQFGSMFDEAPLFNDQNSFSNFRVMFVFYREIKGLIWWHLHSFISPFLTCWNCWIWRIRVQWGKICKRKKFSEFVTYEKNILSQIHDFYCMMFAIGKQAPTCSKIIARKEKKILLQCINQTNWLQYVCNLTCFLRKFIVLSHSWQSNWLQKGIIQCD